MPFTPATVVGTADLGPRLRRITLRIAEPAALAIPDAGDAAVGVYFDGTPDGDARTYTVRRHVRDGPEDHIDVDVVLHADGPGTSWAVTAAYGHLVGLDHARSWYRPDPRASWQLLVSDLSGLPATARIIERLGEGTPATVVVEVLDHDDLAYLPPHPAVTLLPVLGTGNGVGGSGLADAVRRWPRPPGVGYCWFAGEAAQARAVRKHFRAAGWSVDQLDVTGYWRSDSEAWDARFAATGDSAVQAYAQALAAGRGDKVAAEEFDEALERLGL